MKYCLAILTCLCLFNLSCSKTENNTACWQLIDPQGNRLNEVCNKTEAQMQQQYPNPCSYYKTSGDKFCWLVNDSDYFEGLTQDGINKIIQCFRGGNGTAVKVACGYCKFFFHRIKRTYKPTGSVIFSAVTKEKFCGDTAKVLFDGRQVTLKDTPDSLVMQQFSSTGKFQ